MKPHPVVVAFDFSLQGAAVLDRAVALVARAPFHVLHFVTVLDPHSGIPAIPPDGPVDYQYADRVRDAILDEVQKAFGMAAVSEEAHFFVHARIGKPAKEILDLAEEIGAELVLVGTHGRTGLSRMVMGSTAEHVVREAGCPVLVVRPKHYADIELTPVEHVEGHPHRLGWRGFSYKNNQVVVRPPDWINM